MYFSIRTLLQLQLVKQLKRIFIPSEQLAELSAADNSRRETTWNRRQRLPFISTVNTVLLGAGVAPCSQDEISESLLVCFVFVYMSLHMLMCACVCHGVMHSRGVISSSIGWIWLALITETQERHVPQPPPHPRAKAMTRTRLLRPVAEIRSDQSGESV